MSEYARARGTPQLTEDDLRGPGSLFGEKLPEVQGVAVRIDERAVAIESLMKAYNQLSQAYGLQQVAESDAGIKERYGRNTSRVVDGALGKAALSKIDIAEAVDVLYRDEELIAAGFDAHEVKADRELVEVGLDHHFGPQRDGVDARTRQRYQRKVSRAAETILADE